MTQMLCEHHPSMKPMIISAMPTEQSFTTIFITWCMNARMLIGMQRDVLALFNSYMQKT
jgi:hypothetical protein